MITELRNAAAGFILRIAEAFNPDPESKLRTAGTVVTCPDCDGDGYYYLGSDDYLCDECRGKGKIWVPDIVPADTDVVVSLGTACDERKE